MSNMLRGSLTSTSDAKGILGFKGERGYSNYEIYVKNGGTMTEQEWLEHFGVDLTDYIKTSEVNAIVGDLEELETTDKTDVVSAINELNTNINSLDDRDSYSTTEKVVGTWIDGKPLYRKVINFGALPNASQKKVQHGISNMEWVVNAWAVSKRTNQDNTHTWFPINQARADAYENNIGLWVEDTDITIQTGIDRSTSLETYVILEYTKTTD